jgi:hypothetical protein
LLLSFLKVNLRGYIDTDQSSALNNNIRLIWYVLGIVWVDYIFDPISIIWNEYIKPFFRGDFLSGLKEIQSERTILPESS